MRSRIIGLEQNIDISDEILNLIALSKQNGEVVKDSNNNWVMKISDTTSFWYCETGHDIDRSNTIDQILRKSTVCTRLKQIFDQCGFDYGFEEKMMN